MIGIVMVDRNWSLDSNGKQPIHLQKDLARFEEITTGNIVIMGRKTLEQLPGGKPLKDRTNLVLSTTQDNQYDTPTNMMYFPDDVRLYSFIMNDLAPTIRNVWDITYVIGGAQVLNHFMELGWLEYLFVTKVSITFPNPTTHLLDPVNDLPITRRFKLVPYIQQIRDYNTKTGDSFNTELRIYVKEGPIDVHTIPG